MKTSMQARPEVIRVSELPGIFNLSISTIYNHIQQGLLPQPFSLGAGSSGVLREEVYSLLSFISTGASMEERRDFVSGLPSQRRSK